MNRVTTNCPTCAQAGEQGSCARHRCYCGHAQCWAFDSYVPRTAIQSTVTVRKADERMARSWAERDEPTWLDR